jgi:O-methyltransferase
MIRIIRKIYHKILSPIFFLPLLIYFLLRQDIGSDYHIGVVKKIYLILKFIKTTKKVPTVSSWLEHLEMAAAVLKIPSSVKGDVIECGCYKGGSTINLSIICSMVGRKLIVCDSFKGLPKPPEDEKVHYSIHTDHFDYYEEGLFSAALEEVKDNLTRYGCIDVCEFVVGYFEDTLKDLNKEYVMAFFDADLVQSLKPCLLEIWPNLQEGCRMFVHEARSLTLVALFFDKQWWQNNLHTEPPGFVGAGTGLPLKVVAGSEIGYAQKGHKLILQ